MREGRGLAAAAVLLHLCCGAAAALLRWIKSTVTIWAEPTALEVG